MTTSHPYPAAKLTGMRAAATGRIPHSWPISSAARLAGRLSQFDELTGAAEGGAR